MRTTTILLGLALGLFLVAACGDNARVDVVAKAPGNFLAGIDRSEPLPERPGFARKEVLSRGYELKPWDVNIHTEPFRVSPFSRDEDVWVTNWHSNTENEQGEREPDDIHCHAIFSMDPVLQDDVQDFRGLFTDGFSPVFTLPEGFAVRVRRGERMMFQPMFNNRRPEGRIARMRLHADFVPDSKKPREYVELRATILRASLRDIYWVEGGQFDRRTRVVEAPFQGRIHAVGAHLHPYGLYVELEDELAKSVIATCRLRPAEKPEDARLDILHFPAGIYIKRGQKLRVTTVYENTSATKIDAMGGMYVLYDPLGKPDA